MKGIEVTVYNSLEKTSKVHRFRKTSVRVGRNPLNDLALESGYVSQFHAVIELQDDVIVLRDLGSTNGSAVGGARVAPNAAVVLPAGACEFQVLNIIKFKIRAVPLESIPQARSSKGPMAVTGMIAQPTAAMLAAINAAKAEAAAPRPEEEENLNNLYRQYRMSWSSLHKAMQEAVMQRSPEQRGSFASKLSIDLAGVTNEPEFHDLAELADAQSLQMRDHDQERNIAINGLRELAQEYMPDLPAPESADDLVRFLTRLRATLDVFLNAFLPLRDGQRQFREELGMGRSAINPTDPVELAKKPTDISAALLGTEQANDALGSVESVFADLMIHHVAMLNGVMNGVKNLMGELSPESVQKYAEQLVERGAMQRGLGGLGPKKYWQAYLQRHADLSSEEAQLFTLLFGRQFNQAYTQAASETGQYDRRSAPPTALRTAELHVPPGGIPRPDGS